MYKKVISVGFAAVCVFFTSVKSVAEAQALAPPELYSEAAVLMDADTGQVLWEKNMDKKMYPASLTKVMTCLLAIENGDPETVITVTEESTRVGETTKLALTEGETLTLEQLNYGMMVESANDAANVIAVHLGGTMDNFARMMNDRALQIGALNTHFTNPSGLPDDKHYTTAYDLGLITRAALAQPEFRLLAGAQEYTIPPTNKQPDTRHITNKQYMFCLNDTYPGAFAGKTGWTEEAGHTLITIAEREGVTLIAVVLKADGEIDAQYKDSTALLDYGYDHFSQTNIPLETLQTAVDEQAAGAYHALSISEYPLFLPTGIQPADLQMEVDRISDQLVLTAGDTAKAYMAQQIGSIALSPVAAPPVATGATQETEDSGPLGTFLGILKWVGIVLGSLVVILFLFLLVLRQVLLMQHRKKMRLRARRQRQKKRKLREQAERMRYKDNVIDITQKTKYNQDFSSFL